MSAFSTTQRAVADASSHMQNVQQTVNLQLYLEIYFQIEVVEVGADNEDFADFDFATSETAVLEPGKQYRVVVWTELNGQLGQRSVRVDSDLDLMLMLKGEKGVVYEVAIANPQVHLLEDDAKHFRHEFGMTVADELPNTEANLLLGYRPSQSGQKPRLAVSQPVKLAGTFNPPDEELLEKCKVALDSERPPETAIIHVQNGKDEGQLKLTCWGHYADRTINTRSFTPPPVRLADFVETQKDPLTILAALRAFSISNPDLELVDWLDKLRHRPGFQLVIVDHTDYEIPWEMLELADDVYLGAVVPVARWFPIPYYKKQLTQNVQITAEHYEGRVIAYLESQGLSLSQLFVERELLEQFDTRFHMNVSRLYDTLSEVLQGVGLVYLGCHGIFTPSSIDATAIGSWHNPSNRLVTLQLELLPYSESLRPIIFVNACHSARLAKYGEGLYGLPIVMLRRIASGYIGTLGPIGNKYAGQIAGEILKDAGTDKGILPVETLRQLREKVTQQLLANRGSRDNQLLFIYAYMYVYYGNPLAHLRLLRARDKGGSDE